MNQFRRLLFNNNVISNDAADWVPVEDLVAGDKVYAVCVNANIPYNYTSNIKLKPVVDTSVTNLKYAANNTTYSLRGTNYSGTPGILCFQSNLSSTTEPYYYIQYATNKSAPEFPSAKKLASSYYQYTASGSTYKKEYNIIDGFVPNFNQLYFMLSDITVMGVKRVSASSTQSTSGTLYYFEVQTPMTNTASVEHAALFLTKQPNLT